MMRMRRCNDISLGDLENRHFKHTQCIDVPYDMKVHSEVGTKIT